MYPMYFNVSIVYLYIFENIWMYFNKFIVYFNVFFNLKIGILPSHFSWQCFYHAHLPIHLFFTIHTDSLPNMLYHYPLFSNSHWSVLTFIQFIKVLHSSSYPSCLYIIPTFYVFTNCMETSKAQVGCLNH